MSSGLRKVPTLGWMLAAALVPATFGFWGQVLVPVPAVQSGPLEAAELWLEEPVPAVQAVQAAATRTGSAGPTEPAARGARNPFLTAAEDRRAGGRSQPRPAAASTPAARDAAPVGRDAAPGWPRLEALVRVGDEWAAVLDGRVVRAGGRAGGCEVVQVQSDRVQLRGRDGLGWLTMTGAGHKPGTRGR